MSKLDLTEQHTRKRARFVAREQITTKYGALNRAIDGIGHRLQTRSVRQMKTIAKQYSGIGLIGVLAALATLVTGEPAYARQRHQSCQTAYNSQANPNYGFGPRVCVHPHDVVVGDRIIGRDPDPNVRFDIMRQQNFRNGG
jgi:hypothetical protein